MSKTHTFGFTKQHCKFKAQFDHDLACSGIVIILPVINDLLHTRPYFAKAIILGNAVSSGSVVIFPAGQRAGKG